MPDTEERSKFWSNIWGTGKSHNKDAKWLKKLISEKNRIKQGHIQISTGMVNQQTRKVSYWKCPGPDEIQSYETKNFSSITSKKSNTN